MKHFKTWLFITALIAATYIVFTDAGDGKNRTSGAGDIWWTDTADIDQAYRSIMEKKTQ